MSFFNSKLGFSVVLFLGVAAGSLALASQSDEGAKQDIKNAGHETKAAAKDTGRATKKTARKTGHQVKRTTKKAANKSARATERGAEKVEDKTNPN
jgi:Ni/Co efflux regulator RcnB